MPLRPWTLFFALALILAGCRIDNPESPTETPPLLFRASVPADSTEGLIEPEGLDFVVRFRRAIEEQDAPVLRMFPRPVSSDSVLVGEGGAAQVVWRALTFDPGQPVYKLLVDGPTMIAPTVLTYFPVDKPPITAAISGKVYVSRPGLRAEDAIVFALRVGESPLPPEDADYLGLQVFGLTQPYKAISRESAHYRINGLASSQSYLICAILDTDGNGRYELEHDWWGYHRVGPVTDSVPVFVRAGIPLGSMLTPPVAEEPTDVDVLLLGPGILDPDLGL